MAAVIATPELRTIADKYLPLGVSLDIFEYNDHINLSTIVVPKERRSQGIGSSLMNEICQYATRVGKIIVLSPSSDLGGSKTRLIPFYRRFGFVPNKGRNKDYRFPQTMIRRP